MVIFIMNLQNHTNINAGPVSVNTVSPHRGGGCGVHDTVLWLHNSHGSTTGV